MNGVLATDLSFTVGGQGGDGSLTLVSLIGDLLAHRAYHVYEAREVGSRVKGGPAVASLRATSVPRGCLGDGIDVLVAFDPAVLAQNASRLGERSVVIYDASDAPAPRERIPAGATVLEVPFSRLAVRDLRRDLYKNSLAFGVVTRLLGATDAESERVLLSSLAKLPEQLKAANARAMRAGFEYAERAGIRGLWSLASAEVHERMLVTGNEAIALGFLAAGGRFFAGYPITPASEILELLAAELPKFGGVVVQAEDELAAANMAIGAAMTGTRAMTASSGPGIALMQEAIGHLGSAEVGIVIVDCQRAGPSTGMPTKPEQSDISMLVGGTNGDIPRIVLAPSDPREAFEITALAVNLAERYQGPVMIAMDQAVSQHAMTIDAIDLSAVRIDRGKLLDEKGLVRLSEFRRYSLDGDHDGISPWVPFGTAGGQHLVTGNEHDEWGLVTTDPAMRRRQIEKRARKLETVTPLLPRARISGDPASDVALVAFGLAAAVVDETAERLATRGHGVRVVRPRTLWPVLDDVLEILLACRTYVVEHNAGAQYTKLLAAAARSDCVRAVLRYDGLPFRPGELVAAIEAYEAQ